MAASSDCAAVKKCPLQNTFMYVQHVRSGSERKSISFLIKIHKVSTMKDITSSTNPLPYKDWILNVSKYKSVVTLTLRTSGEGVHNVICRVWYALDSPADTIGVNKVSDDIYIMNVSSEITPQVPGNLSVRQTDSLICELDVVLARIMKINRPVIDNRFAKNDKSAKTKHEYHKTEAGALIQDLTYKINCVDFADFKIKIKDSARYVHKPVIAARSKFFFDYLKENPDSEEIEIDASIEAFDLLYFYMYHGEIYAPDVPTILVVMKLAKKLQMMKLYEMCCNFVLDSLDASNAQLIKQMGNNMDDDTLVSAADEILARK